MFWELFRDSIIVQSFVTACLVATFCYLIATGHEVTDAFVNIVMLVLGFWFGTKIEHTIASKRE